MIAQILMGTPTIIMLIGAWYMADEWEKVRAQSQGMNK